MKTLDKVIDAVERCETYPNCHFCYLHSGPICKWIRDALHYLEILQDMTCGTSQKLRNTSQITCPKCHSEFVILPDANNPLTWQELQHMEGKPVWVEYNLHIGNKDFRDNSKRWCIVREFKPWHDTEIIITENGFVLSKNEQIKCWQAYRKERS